MSIKTEVAGKTTPNLREETRTNNETIFEKDYLAQLDDSAEVPSQVKDAQLVDVRQSALQRGLKPTADAKLTKTIKVDERNVRLIYGVPVELNRPATEVHLVAAAQQPDDTDVKADIDEPSKEG